MSRLKRILSFLMAIVIMMSTLSIVAQGKRSYLDGYLTNYDDVDRPVVTFGQTTTMVLDAVDALLKEKNMIIDVSILGELRLNSVNNAMNDLVSLRDNGLFVIAKGLLGDLKDLNTNSLKASNSRRTAAQDDTDVNTLYALLGFLSDNRVIFKKVINGNLSLGVASSALDLSSINVSKMVKEALFKAANKGQPIPATLPNTDLMIQKLLTDLVQGKLDPVTGEYDGIAPELVPYIDINNPAISTYDFFGTLLQQAWNVVLVPLISEKLSKTVREACGVVYDPLLEDNPLYTGDDSHLNEYAEILDINFVVPEFTFPSGSTFLSQLNNLLASVVNPLMKDYTWAAGDNTNLKANFVAAAKYILGVAGDGLFPDYLDVKPIAEVNAMMDQELVSYLLRSVLNGAIDTIYIPDDADSLVEVAWYGVKEALASKLPAINYAAQPQTKAGVLTMVADLLASVVNEKTDMNPAAGTVPGTGLIAYGQGLDATLLAVTNWLRTNYLGLVNRTFSTTNAWAVIDELIFNVVAQGANWLPASVNGNSELLFNTIVDDVLTLNVDGLLSLLGRVPNNELATKSIKQILINVVTRVINSIFPNAVGAYSSFETIVNNDNLANIVEQIILQLNNRRTAIMPVLTPLLAQLLKKSVPQAYNDPDIQLPAVVGAASTFAIANDSAGINTGATDANGNFVRDNLYKIQVVSVTSSIPAITVTYPAGEATINGGGELVCSLGGTFTPNQQLMITVTYNVLTQNGSVMTPIPLSQRAFSYISTVVDDGTVWTTVDPDTGNLHKVKYNASYLNSPAAPDEPQQPAPGAPQAEFDAYTTAHAQWVLDVAQNVLDRNASMKGLESFYTQLIRDGGSTGSGNRDATTTRTASTIDSVLINNGVTVPSFATISSNGDGYSFSAPYYTVGESATRPADGLYSDNFAFKAQKTKLLGKDESFSIPHKLVLYTDYGLPSLLEGAIGANRDPNNYSVGPAYDNYITAIKNAVAVVYRPRQAASFMTTHAPLFGPAATNLKAAIAALDETAISAGAESLKVAIDTVELTNSYDDPANPGMKLWYEYDDANYNYFGKEDYVVYTYNRYTAERDNARGIWDSQQLPKAPVLRTTPAPTPEEQDAYDMAYAQWLIDYAAAVEALNPVKDVDVAYALNRLNLYTSRLVRVPAIKDRLNETIALVQGKMPVAYGCSAAQWEKFERAYNFALAVSADADVNLRQTKVITARDTLIETWKKMTQVFVEVPTETGFEIDNVNFYIAGLAIDEIIDTFVSATGGGTVVFTETPEGQGTGTVVDLMSGEDLIRSYTIIIYGDISGDASTTATDALMALQTAADLSTLSPIQTIAGDVSSDDEVSSTDALMILQYSAGLISSFD